MIGVLGALLAGMLQLAVGMHATAFWCDGRASVTRGFLALSAATSACLAILAALFAGVIQVESAERSILIAFSVAQFVYLVLLVGEQRKARLVCGGFALLLGSGALVLAALTRPSPALGPVTTLLAFLVAATALGSAVGGMLLGHWYLVTPKLTARPLRDLCDLLLVSLIPLSVLAAWFALGGRGGQSEGIGGLSGVVLWIGAGMITVFPFTVTVAARICCVDGPGRGRSLQAATGLMYLVAAAVLAGGLAGNAVLLGA